MKATNRQTEVKAEQLIALSDFQKKLEAFFKTFENGRKLYYERRSRQYNHVAGIEKTRIVTPTNLIRAYASMFLEEPHRTTRTYRALLEKLGTGIFGPDHKLEPYYLAAFAAYRLEYLFRNQQLDSKYKPARYHVLMAARLLKAPRRPPQPNSRDMQRYCDAMQEDFWDTNQAEEVFRRAARVVDSVAQGNYHRDHVRTQTFTERVRDACSRGA